MRRRNSELEVGMLMTKEEIRFEPGFRVARRWNENYDDPPDGNIRDLKYACIYYTCTYSPVCMCRYINFNRLQFRGEFIAVS